ncbi:Uncharacterized protein SCF082_LOCUS32872, partial [Durusdinium trenchii]
DEMKLSREFYIPANATKYASRACPHAVAYTYTNERGELCGVGFHGRASKPDWRYRFRSPRDCERKITEHFSAWEAHEARKKDKKRKGRGVELGQILYSSWGYDQTNIDFFKVTKLVGKTMVEIVEIGSNVIDTPAWETRSVIPDETAEIGQPLRRRCENGRVSVDNALQLARLHAPRYHSGAPSTLEPAVPFEQKPAAIPADQFVRIGQSLYGERWQADMARALEMSLRNVQYLAAGERPVHAGIASDLLDILPARGAELAQLLH